MFPVPDFLTENWLLKWALGCCPKSRSILSGWSTSNFFFFLLFRSFTIEMNEGNCWVWGIFRIKWQPAYEQEALLSDSHGFSILSRVQGCTNANELGQQFYQKKKYPLYQYLSWSVNLITCNKLKSKKKSIYHRVITNLFTTPAAFFIFNKMCSVMQVIRTKSLLWNGCHHKFSGFWLGIVLSYRPSDTQTCHNTTLRASSRPIRSIAQYLQVRPYFMRLVALNILT